MTPAFFNPRVRSLARANVLVVGSVIMATLMSGFPRLRPTLWLIIPTLLAFIGTVDTLRNIQRRWSLYHGGVILCLYMDLMVISIVLFFLLYPYFLPLSGGIH